MVNGTDLRYKLHGLVVKSNVVLPGLAAADPHGTADLTFDLRPDHIDSGSGLDLNKPAFVICQQNGDAFLEMYETHRHYVMRFPSAADFWVKIDGSSVFCHSRRNVTEALVRQFFLGWVFSLVLQLHRIGGLHGGAVSANGKALGFVGSSGAGKSSLVTAFAMAGCPVLTEEVLAYNVAGDEVYALPGYQEIRLTSESVSELERYFGHSNVPTREDYDKLAIRLDGVWGTSYPERLPMSVLYLLTGEEAKSGRPEFERVDPMDAPRDLLRHSFVVPKYYRDFLNIQFKLVCQMSSIVPIWRLTCPRNMSALPEVVDTIMRHEIGSSPRELARTR